MGSKITSGKGAASPGVLASVAAAYKSIGHGLVHYLVDNPLLAQQAVGTAIRHAGLDVINLFTFGEFKNVAPSVFPQPKPGPRNHDYGNDGGDGLLGALKFENPSTMKFNLPPHNWSLPVNPSKLDSSISSTTSTQTNHATRRAIMWYYGGADITTGSGLLDTSGNNITGTAVSGSSTYSSTPADNYWGFQFLWNPTELGAVTTRNSNVVPSVMDAHAWANGLFTAMEALQFTIVIDRVNDFACAKAVGQRSSSARAADSWTPNIDISAYNEIITKYYTEGYPNTGANPKEDPIAQLTDLLKKGTMADIEYIYKMINGSGQQGKVWQNGLGRTTADLSFLSPTAIAIQFGPTPDSLSYVGWIENLNVTHNIFTESMIPIHSTVTVSFNAFSRVALGSKN